MLPGMSWQFLILQAVSSGFPSDRPETIITIIFKMLNLKKIKKSLIAGSLLES